MADPYFIPRPIDTSAVALPEEVADLVERLSRNVHDLWAQGRIKEGWTYGPVRDGARLTHPSLVPYEDLDETEKDYDRRSAMETLRVILALGFRILPPGKPLGEG